ncbi:hypothetical protein PV04_03329 [Phialophora macrospora]|uniref:Uncharacterized protein n=1 Tax=Phialophora macrospora TaxID=1851006 RepID=A0A0D2FXD2_9EURO|nr:hypothetical protein PV04_03329 [Phialophora macrospora]
MYNNGDYEHYDQQQNEYGDDYGHTDGHQQYPHGGDEYNEWDLETIKVQLREKCTHYANDHANDEMDENDQQDELHNHSLIIVQLAEQILQSEPDNPGAKQLHDWFSRSVKGKFYGHPELEPHHHKVRHPREGDEPDDDDGNEQNDENENDEDDGGHEYGGGDYDDHGAEDYDEHGGHDYNGQGGHDYNGHDGHDYNEQGGHDYHGQGDHDYHQHGGHDYNGHGGDDYDEFGGEEYDDHAGHGHQQHDNSYGGHHQWH